MTKILDRVVSVEYALKDDGDRGDSPRRGGYGRRGDSPRGRSVSPLPSRGRPSPDYGRPRSPASPGYGRARSPVSPGYKRARSPVSPGYGRARSPVYDGYNGGPSYDRERSPEYAAARYRSRSPVRRSRT
ncbi:serine/arginine-rich splicing factor RS31-like [Iris pallida]|nr:serine/arginine-rich splicing factor RS31-like [Iris pallida]